MASFWNGFKTGIYDIFTFGGYSKERERERQEELNKLQLQREDNAYQRTVEDMNKAGLNPLTMSGTNNAQPLTNPIKSENNAFDKAVQLATTISSVATGLAQAKNLNASTAGMGITNAMAQKDLDYLTKKGLSPTEYEHQRQKELANLNKGFWGKVGNDLYDNVGEKINGLIEKGTNIVENGIQSLGKGEFKDAVKETTKNIYEEKADQYADQSWLGGKGREWKQNKKEKTLEKIREEMNNIQEKINKYSSSTSTENIKKVNELRKKYEEEKQKYENYKIKHWTQF